MMFGNRDFWLEYRIDNVRIIVIKLVFSYRIYVGWILMYVKVMMIWFMSE